MKTATLKLRLDLAELERWKRLASTAGVTLSEWIRGKCAALLTGPDVPQPKTATEAVMRAENRPKRTAKQAKSAEACPHGALRQFCRFAECRSKR
jgi:hypothetical protein